MSLKLLISLLVASVIVLTVLVWIYEWRSKPEKKISRQELVSLSTIPPNMLMYLLMAPFWAQIYLFMAQYAWLEIETNWFLLPLTLLLCDFSYYVEHRIGHQCNLVWRLYHGTHHTGTSYNIPLAFRVNALNMLLAPLFYLPWVMLGIEPLLVVGFQLLVFHYQGWLHTELIKTTCLDSWINTPANHRIHHSQTHQANFGGVLMIWDRLFGTYVKPLDSINYGIKGFKFSDSYVGIYTEFLDCKPENSKNKQD